MSFSSINFLFILLPVTLVLYYLVRSWKWRNLVLLAASLLFFAWGDFGHLPLLVGLVLLNYGIARWIEAYAARNQPKAAQRVMWLGVGLNILILWFSKYLGFSVGIFQQITGTQFEFIEPKRPLGISYFTFSSLSYLLDVYYGVEKAEHNLLRFGNYIVMFPKLLQGPITRFGQVKAELQTAAFNYEEILDGVRRFIVGLAKKVIIADTIAAATKKILAVDMATIGADVAWFAVIAFTLQIYFDFSGYTDMAVGLGKMLGFRLPENFNYPYISRSITEFWRRWHMTLTAWFRTYLFIPLEFARKNVKHLRQQTNLFIVFLLTGLWHDASWNFIIWGGYFGIILVIEASGWGRKLKTLPRVLQHLYALLLIMVGWIFFRLINPADWGPFFGALVGAHGWSGVSNFRTLNIVFYVPLMIAAGFLSLPWLKQKVDALVERSTVGSILVDGLLLCLFALTVAYVLSNGYAAFMYGSF